MKKKKTLDELREELRRKDLALVKLLNERARISVEVGKVKGSGGREIYDPSQEGRLYGHLEEINDGPLTDEALKTIFREILSSSRALQGPEAVAYLGPEASFSHLAALSHFGKSARLQPSATISDVFRNVEKEKARWGIVPMENSIEGSVKQTMDGLIATPLSIRAEVFMRISHCLLSAGTDIQRLRRVYSHPHALAQCRGWLASHVPGCSLVEVESTAAAALRVLKDAEGAAVGSAVAGESRGLHVLAEGIEDHALNTTRFLVIGRGQSAATGLDKTSVLFSTPHAPGALHKALTPFAENRVNLLRIESCPMRDRMWEYLFFADLEGHRDDSRVAGCLKEMEGVTAFIKILGSYPRGNGQ